MQIFQERLKELRIASNLSARELANKIGVSFVAIYKWEKGDRMSNLEYLVALAKYFKVSIDYLCGLED